MEEGRTNLLRWNQGLEMGSQTAWQHEFSRKREEVFTYDVNLENRCRFKEDVQPIEVARCDPVANNNECFAVKSIIHQNISDPPMGP